MAKELLDKVIAAMQKVIPMPVELVGHQECLRYDTEFPIEVSIGLTGALKGELSIRTSESFFTSLGVQMYGFPMEGEMLQSFAGEALNMIAGNFSSLLFESGTKIDIAVPTVRLQVGAYIPPNPLWQGDVVIDGTEKAVILLTYKSE